MSRPRCDAGVPFGVAPSSSWTIDAAGVRPLGAPPRPRNRSGGPGPRVRDGMACRRCGGLYRGRTNSRFCGAVCAGRAVASPAARVADRGRYALLRAAGLCTSCGIRPADGARCLPCADKLAAGRPSQGAR